MNGYMFTVLGLFLVDLSAAHSSWFVDL